ncbi:TPA: HNH endonuclease [Pseudomonas aeruginosa]|uniref:HNH endonuclease n=1 Tax=Pseudomonas aeruginosa TaxID=287 RepID=UPI003B91A66C|nr:HNH endonuclease [Pseudomonas aeruginosa]HBO3018875.1 HNH endonuclease [Pseudomonas aeruginosa]HBO3916545.1 HNH endonuclease [Pseudomonas aeruginosa]HCF5891416.1 HNH endonuclease [Pseudomonas aeruginosa]
MARKAKKMAAAIELGQEELGQLLTYDPDSGLLRWKEKPLLGLPSDRLAKGWNRKFASAVAGTRKQSAGKEYTQINIKGRYYPCHRIIWVMVHGAIDETLVIDHINGDGRDNRLINLRLVTHSQNQRNQVKRRTNSSGVTGVYRCCNTGKWTGQITVDGRHLSIGSYALLEDAAKARKRLEREHGYHPLHGMAASLKAMSI